MQLKDMVGVTYSTYAHWSVFRERVRRLLRLEAKGIDEITGLPEHPRRVEHGQVYNPFTVAVRDSRAAHMLDAK
jgi:hypothetical protein